MPDPQAWAHNGVVAAFGVHTDHWKRVSTTFPGICNCCIDVRKVFHKEWHESTAGSGFDKPTRSRMKAKDTWAAVFQVGLCILNEFRLLIVLCNHGKHRSLSVAYEVANRAGAELVSIRERAPPYPYRKVHDVLNDLGSHLRRHCELFEQRPHHVVGIRLCQHEFDGDAWAAGESAEYRNCRYLNLKEGDVLVDVHLIQCERAAAQGWALGFLVGGCGRPSWYPPEYVRPLPSKYFPGCENFQSCLIPRCLPRAKLKG